MKQSLLKTVKLSFVIKYGIKLRSDIATLYSIVIPVKTGIKPLGRVVICELKPIIRPDQNA
ncbi:hypothetical protein SOASR029_34520 [Budvicia aquatica]|nr:hypothetical protein SOASR029_34520 [Budvicia aquatica]